MLKGPELILGVKNPSNIAWQVEGECANLRCFFESVPRLLPSIVGQLTTGGPCFSLSVLFSILQEHMRQPDMLCLPPLRRSRSLDFVKCAVYNN